MEWGISLRQNKMHSISTKLIAAFVITLIMFSIMISILFGKFYTEHVFQTDLLNTNINLCATISDYIEEEDIEFTSLNIFHNRRDFNFIGNIAAMESVEVWLITFDHKVISHNENKGMIEVDEIPTRYLDMVQELFEGKYIESHPYKKIWNRNMIGVGAPIIKEGRIVGAAIMQMDEDQVLYAASNTIRSLIHCLAIAIPIVGCVAGFLAKAILQPLGKLKLAAMELCNGNYDISTCIRKNDEIGLLADMMDQLAIRLKEAQCHRTVEDERRNNFLSGISHELRTPISVIKVQLEALSDGIITDENERSEYYQSMQSEINGLQRLVNDLLDLSKLSSENFQMKFDSVNLKDVLSNSIRSVRAYANQSGIQLSLKIHGKHSDTKSVQSDYDRLRQLLLIFLDNAIKYSGDGTVVTIEFWAEESTRICISDQGRGIPSEEIPFIFERFYRGKRVEDVNGSGLGLAIAQQIASQLNIHLSLKSSTQGTTVTILF